MPRATFLNARPSTRWKLGYSIPLHRERHDQVHLHSLVWSVPPSIPIVHLSQEQADKDTAADSPTAFGNDRFLHAGLALIITTGDTLFIYARPCRRRCFSSSTCDGFSSHTLRPHHAPIEHSPLCIDQCMQSKESLLVSVAPLPRVRHARGCQRYPPLSLLSDGLPFIVWPHTLLFFIPVWGIILCIRSSFFFSQLSCSLPFSVYLLFFLSIARRLLFARYTSPVIIPLSSSSSSSSFRLSRCRRARASAPGVSRIPEHQSIIVVLRVVVVVLRSSNVSRTGDGVLRASFSFSRRPPAAAFATTHSRALAVSTLGAVACA